MADSLLKKKKKDSGNDFSWIGDPAEGLRGKPGRRISDDDYRAMLNYNRNLVEPLDRGGGQALRIGGQPVRLAGSDPNPISTPARTVSGFETTSPGGAARIANRYGGIGAASTFGAPGSPAGAVQNPNLTQPVAPVASAPVPGAVPNPNLNPVPTASNPALQPITDDGSPLVPVAGAAPADTRGAASTFGAGDGVVTNPNTGAPAVAPDGRNDPAQNPALADWMAKGGSLATFHRAQVAAGLRAPIDAHTDPDPLGSHASTDIQKAHGWSGQGASVDARDIAKQMTGEFNQNNAAAQAAWNQKFKDAHAKTVEAMNSN